MKKKTIAIGIIAVFILTASGCSYTDSSSSKSHQFSPRSSLSMIKKEVPLKIDQKDPYILRHAKSVLTIHGRAAPKSTIFYRLPPDATDKSGIEADQNGRFTLKIPVNYKNDAFNVVARNPNYLENVIGVGVVYKPWLISYKSFYSKYEASRSEDQRAVLIVKKLNWGGILSVRYSSIMFQGEFDPVSPSELKNIYLIYDKKSGTAEALDRFIHTYIVTSEALGFKRAATEAALKKFGSGKINLEQHMDQVDVTIRVDDHSINTHFFPAGS